MRKALDIDPRHEFDRRSLTDFPYINKELKSYATSFERAKVSATGRSLRLSSEGIIRFHAGQVKRAKGLFAKALKDDSHNHAALLYSALMKLSAGNKKAAKAHLQSARRSTAGAHPVTQLYLAEVEMASGRLEQARKRLDELVDSEPNLTQAKYLLGRLFLQQRKHSKGTALLRDVIRVSPDFRPAKRALANAQY